MSEADTKKTAAQRSGSGAPRLSREEVGEVYRRYGDLLLRRCRIVLGDDALADDAFQEAFVNIIRYGAAFRRADAPLRWLYTVCDNACFGQLRKRKRHDDKVDAAERAALAGSTVRPHVLTAQLEARSEVLRFLGGLEETDYRIAVLSFVDGLSQGDVGRELSLSRQTVNKRLTRIREQAQQHRKQLIEGAET